MVWQCSTEGHEVKDLFQDNFANSNTIRLAEFVAINDKN